MVEINQPLDMDAPDAEAFMRGVQGNIIKGHGRDHTAHVFVTFPKDASPIRPWIVDFATNRVVTAATQWAQSKARQRTGGPGEPFQTIQLSHLGYLALGVDQARIPSDPFFRAGLKNHNEVGRDPFNDPAPALWEPRFQPDLHAMVLLAHDLRTVLDVMVMQTVAELEALGCACYVERGDKLIYDFGPPRGALEIEHFGHQDGVSNPRMVAEDIATERAERGSDKWDPAATLDLVLVADPGAEDAYGSYMVFRKLEQNVRRFKNEIANLAAKLGVDVDGAAALVVGRHRDGTPAIPTATPGATADPNNFNFKDDRPDPPAAARLCPFQSHIRRSNPRGDIPHYTENQATAEFERSMRIARRGITYGERPDLYNPDPEKQPDAGVGLLFMSFQGNLRQFAIQQAGSDGETFPHGSFTGIDAIVGQPADPNTARPQAWPEGGPNRSVEVTHLMMNFVTLKGGEYFFSPSIASLKSI
jgi:deferrochelatase/peroxidase EfeB